MSSSSSAMRPMTRQPSMVSFMRLSERRKVDLPQPEGPMSEVTWFCSMLRSTSNRACFKP